MSMKLPKQFWYFHENSDSYTQMTRQEWETSTEAWCLHELGAVKEGTNREAIKFHNDYMKINLPYGLEEIEASRKLNDMRTHLPDSVRLCKGTPTGYFIIRQGTTTQGDIYRDCLGQWSPSRRMGDLIDPNGRLVYARPTKTAKVAKDSVGLQKPSAKMPKMAPSIRSK